MKRYVLLWQSPSNRVNYSGDQWEAYTFAKEEDRNRMLADIKSGDSAWGGVAVRTATTEIDFPDHAYISYDEEAGFWTGEYSLSMGEEDDQSKNPFYDK